jgi:hypothetical protein
MVASRDEVVFAAFAESTQTQDVQDLGKCFLCPLSHRTNLGLMCYIVCMCGIVDTLLRIGHRWRRQSPYQGLLAVLVALSESGRLSNGDLDILGNITHFEYAIPSYNYITSTMCACYRFVGISSRCDIVRGV